MLRSSYGVPSSWMPICPAAGWQPVTRFCKTLLTVHSIDPSRQMMSHSFHWPKGFSLEG